MKSCSTTLLKTNWLGEESLVHLFDKCSSFSSIVGDKGWVGGVVKRELIVLKALNDCLKYLRSFVSIVSSIALGTLTN